jgi:hypothetical protein
MTFALILPLLLFYPVPFDHIRFIRRNPADGIRRTGRSNGTLVAIQTEVVPDLQVQRSVPEGGASLDTFGASDTEILIDHILKVGLLDEPPLDGRCGTELIFTPGL